MLSRLELALVLDDLVVIARPNHSLKAMSGFLTVRFDSNDQAVLDADISKLKNCPRSFLCGLLIRLSKELSLMELARFETICLSRHGASYAEMIRIDCERDL